eukprot:gb/GFBE01068586.1/.p1 GENE.gb/GFBE01068586.1/~~gb/GFBE01068586.1/.p1  ORF type:complete len:162 (+),score=47.86 gb/GFBE01068586.1/:1-486(+)
MQALEIRWAALGDSHPDTLLSLSAMASLMRAKGDPAKAEQTLRVVVAGLEGAGKRDSVLASTHELGLALKAQGKLEEAEQMVRKALEGQRQRLGSDHPDTQRSIQSLIAMLNSKAEGAKQALDERMSAVSAKLQGYGGTPAPPAAPGKEIAAASVEDDIEF